MKKNKLQKGQIYCVYDKDSFPPAHFNAAENKINQLNKNNPELQYHAAWSNECFELWFILHFANYTSNNGRQHYSEFLKRELKKRNLGKYDKTADNYLILNEYGNPKKAIRYAENLLKEGEGLTPAECAPATKVHELVKELAKYLPDTIRKNIYKSHSKQHPSPSVLFFYTLRHAIPTQSRLKNDSICHTLQNRL